MGYAGLHVLRRDLDNAADDEEHRRRDHEPQQQRRLIDPVEV
jgi:hypothetical protein